MPIYAVVICLVVVLAGGLALGWCLCDKVTKEEKEEAEQEAKETHIEAERRRAAYLSRVDALEAYDPQHYACPACGSGDHAVTYTTLAITPLVPGHLIVVCEKCGHQQQRGMVRLSAVDAPRPRVLRVSE